MDNDPVYNCNVGVGCPLCNQRADEYNGSVFCANCEIQYHPFGPLNDFMWKTLPLAKIQIIYYNGDTFIEEPSSYRRIEGYHSIERLTKLKAFI
jgi:hypothetical protein